MELKCAVRTGKLDIFCTDPVADSLHELGAQLHVRYTEIAAKSHHQLTKNVVVEIYPDIDEGCGP